MLRSFKTEIDPTPEQKVKINRTIGTCRYVYNLYLDHNKALHDKGESFMTGKSFSVWLNNEYIPNNPDKTWIKEAYSKAVKSKKGESTQRANIQKQRLKVQRLHQRIANIRTDYINKAIAEMVKTKPFYIAVEDLNISGLMKNRHLSKAVASQKFYEFRTKLKAKCADNGIELGL